MVDEYLKILLSFTSLFANFNASKLDEIACIGKRMIKGKKFYIKDSESNQ